MVCLQELFRSRVLLPERGPGAVRPGRADPRPDERGAGRGGARARRGRSSARSSSGARPGVYHNTAVVLDADGALRGHLPQDAHPRRSALLREVLLHAGRPGLSRVRHALRPRRRAASAGTSGIPEAARLTALRGRRDPVLSDGDRLASGREGASTARPARRLANDAARHAIANGVLRGGGEPRRARGDAGKADGIEFWGGSFVADPFGKRARARRGATARRSWSSSATSARSTSVRTHWPFLRDRRIDAYGGIDARFIDKPADAGRALRMQPLGLPHAGRVGAARGHVARLAAQRPRLAGQVRADPVGVRRDRPPPRSAASACALIVEDARRGRARATCSAGAGRRRSTAVDFFRAATDRGWTRDFVPALRGAGTGRRSARARAVNWRFNGWAQVPELDDGTTPRGPASRRGSACAPGGRRWARRRVVLEGGAIDVDGAGHAAHHRGVLSRRCRRGTPASAATGIEQRAARAPRRDARALARRRHRRRRHARPRRRPRALRAAGPRRARGGGRPEGRELPRARREPRAAPGRARRAGPHARGRRPADAGPALLRRHPPARELR